MLTTMMILAEPTISAAETKKSLMGLMLIAISLVLSYLTLKALLGPAQQGDYNRTLKIGAASILAMIPLGLGASAVVAMGYGQALAKFGIGLFS
jgi:hypothetical protein